MMFAINDIEERIKAFPSGRAMCPNCKSLVIAKCGELNIWHWAHYDTQNCDSWIHEPTTEWHLKWQGYFKENEIEVYIKRGSQCHIADICNHEGLVIEIQNSSISSEVIFERENFYNKMIWVINSKEFKHNLLFKEYGIDVGKEIWFRWVNTYPKFSDRAYSVVIPPDDEFGHLLPALRSCHYKPVFDNDLKCEIWYNKKTGFLQNIDKPVVDAFYCYLLDTKIVREFEDNINYNTYFKWRFLRRSWVSSTMPLFIDLNNGFLLFVKTLHKNGNGFGKLISRKTFLRKYRNN